MKTSIVKMYKYLSSIEPHLSRLGWISRKFCLSKIIDTELSNSIPSGDLLLDYNINRLEKANKIFDKNLIFFNPNTVRLPICFRIILCLIIFLPYKYMNLFFYIILVLFLNKSLKKDSNIYICNPYSIFHFSLSFLDNYKSVYLNNYRAIKFRADQYYSYKSIIEYYEIKENYKLTEPLDFHFVDESFCVSFYFTSLEHTFPSEVYLRNLSLWVYRNIGLPVKVFLHRYDSKVDKRDSYLEKYGLNNIEPIIQKFDHTPTQDSLSLLSTNQISFSSMSSISHKLLSLDVNHFVFYSEEELRLNNHHLLLYSQKSDNFISIEHDFEKVCELTGLGQYRIKN